MKSQRVLLICGIFFGVGVVFLIYWAQTREFADVIPESSGDVTVIKPPQSGPSSASKARHENSATPVNPVDPSVSAPEDSEAVHTEAVKIAEVIMPMIKEWEEKNVVVLKGLSEEPADGSSLFLAIPPLSDEIRDEIENMAESSQVRDRVYNLVGADSVNHRKLRFFIHESSSDLDHLVVWKSKDEDTAKIDPVSGVITLNAEGMESSSLTSRVGERYGHLYAVGQDGAEE